MTRVSRRKTLSHSEIENFLSDIDVAADMPLPPVTVETVQTEIKAQFYVPLSPPPISMVTHAMDPMRSEVQHIRDFCKATFASYRTGKPLEPTKALCDVGRSILRGSSYPILSRRLLCPENYEYPSSSLEAKKALLLSLSPMLTEAEEQRQKETAACESFTRCKSGKGKSKFSCYDYTDIDVKCQVDFAEYEKRYMLYIGQNKKTYAKDTPLSPSLNYITFQHRQRTKSERISAGFPRRNLQSAMRAQGGSENQIPSNLPPTPRAVGKLTTTKTRLEPVKLDDTTLELVQALLKPKPKVPSVAVLPAVTVPAPTGDAVKGVSATADIAQASAVYENMPPSASAASSSVLPSVVCEQEPRTEITEQHTECTEITEQHTECTEITVTTETSSVGGGEVTITTITVSNSQEDTSSCDGLTTTTLTEDQSTFCEVRSSSQSPPLSPGLFTEENRPMDTEDSVIMSSGESNDRKRKHRGQRARRIDRRSTLSPASVRAMLFEACEEADAAATGAAPRDLSAMEETSESTASDSSAAHQGMLVDFPADSGFPSGDTASVEVLHIATPSSAASEVLYRLQCPVDEDLLFLDDLDRADSPQQDHEHGKKYARSGTPSTVLDLDLRCAAFVSSVSGSDMETERVASECVIVVAQSLPSAVEEQCVCAMDEATPEGEQEVFEGVVTIVEVDMQQRSWTEEVVAAESEEVCMEYASMMMTEVTTSYTTEDGAPEAIDQFSVEKEVTTSLVEEVGAREESTTEVGEETTMLTVEVREESSLTTAEMEVIEDFGRELDDILCDVSALGGSPSSLLHAPHSPGFTSPLSDAEIMCLSPYVPSQSSTTAEDAVLEPVEEMLEFTSPAAVREVLFVSEAREEAEHQLAEELIAEPALSVVVPLDETPVDSISELTVAKTVDFSASPCAVPFPPSHIAQTPVASSPLSLAAALEKCSAEADRSVDLSGYSDGDLSTSMDDSQILFSGHDPELEDFEMLESMVQREFSSGELDWEFSLPVVIRSEEVDSSHLEAVRGISKPSAEMECSSPHTKTSARTAPSSAEPRRSGVSSIPRYSPSAAKSFTPSAHYSISSRTSTSSPLRCSASSSRSAPSSSQKLPPTLLAETTMPSSRQETPDTATVSAVGEVWPEPLDIASVQARAQARFEEKIKVARWQYEWEVVSAQAANSALIRLNRN